MCYVSTEGLHQPKYVLVQNVMALGKMRVIPDHRVLSFHCLELSSVTSSAIPLKIVPDLISHKRIYNVTMYLRKVFECSSPIT